MYAIETCHDILLDRADQAMRIRMPGQGDPSQIPYLANDRVLVQGPLEPQAAFVARLKTAFPAWKTCGSRLAVHREIQTYLQGMQPGVAAVLPEFAIVGGSWDNTTSWTTTRQGDAIGQAPALANVSANWNWNGKDEPWKAWLVLYMSLVATGQGGAGAQTGAVSGPTKGAGARGANVGGVWTPNAAATGGAGFVALSGLSGLVAANVGQWITTSGFGNAGNNGTFPIVAVASGGACTIANPAAVASDTGPGTWSIGSYPFIGPAMPWGSPGYAFGQGELGAPTKDHGELFGGIWKPALTGDVVTGPSGSWGLTCNAAVIQSIRLLLKRWRAAKTFYPDIIVAFDGGTGVAGSAFSSLSGPGSGNPDGTFGGRGKNVGGAWVPNRLVSSTFDCYAQGTGSWPGGESEVS